MRRVLLRETPTCVGVRLQPRVSSCVVNTPKCTSLVHKRPTYIKLFCKEAQFFGKETRRSLATRHSRWSLYKRPTGRDFFGKETRWSLSRDLDP